MNSINLKEHEPASLPGKIAAAIAANDTLSVKLANMMKCMASLKLHGPTLSACMEEMGKLNDSSGDTGLATLKNAIESLEKFHVVVPVDSLTDYKRLATDKLLIICEKMMTTGGHSPENLQNLKAILVMAQNIMSSSDKFDDPIAQVDRMIKTAATMQQGGALESALKSFEQSDYDVAAYLALHAAMQVLPPFQLEEAAALRVIEILTSISTSNGYEDHGGEMTAPVLQAMQVLTSRLPKPEQAKWNLRAKGFQAAVALYGDLHKATEQKDCEITVDTKTSVNALLTSLGRACSTAQDVKKKLHKALGDEEDTSSLDKAVASAGGVTSILATKLAQVVKNASAESIEALSKLAQGVQVEDWKKVLPVDTWQEMHEIGMKHLHPIDIAAMDALLKKVVHAQQEFQDLIGKHAAGGQWEGIGDIVLNARKTRSCARLMKLFGSAGDKKEGEIRREAKAEMALLKRFGIAGTDLPVGMQLRVTAAFKGQMMEP